MDRIFRQRIYFINEPERINAEEIFLVRLSPEMSLEALFL
mgnify:FL=1